MARAYYFKGKMANAGSAPEVLKIIFESRVKIHLASSKTGFTLVDVSDKFYDSPEEKQRCLEMHDDVFQQMVISTFWKQGYRLEKIQDE